MGSPLAHEGEAPFPEALATEFIVSLSNPGDCVCDPFMGSGTTAAVCVRTDRKWVGVDLRESQKELTLRRVAEALKDVQEK